AGVDCETTEGIHATGLALLAHTLPLDYWTGFPARPRHLTSQDVWQATRARLDPERAVIVLVGNAAGFEKDVKKLGPVRVIPARSVDLASASLERPQVMEGRR